MSTIRYADSALWHTPWKAFRDDIIIFRSDFQLGRFLDYFEMYFQSAALCEKESGHLLDFFLFRYKDSILVFKEVPTKNGKGRTKLCLNPAVRPDLDPVDLLFDNRPDFKDAFTSGAWLSPKELAFSQERGFFRLDEAS